MLKSSESAVLHRTDDLRKSTSQQLLNERFSSAAKAKKDGSGKEFTSSIVSHSGSVATLPTKTVLLTEAD